VAKTALVVKQSRKPKFKVRGYTRCQRCGRPKAVFRKFGLCRICLREMAHRGELPGVTKDGEKCTTFADCKELIEASDDIDYDGISGPIELNEKGDPTSAIIGIYTYGPDNKLTTDVQYQQGEV